MKCFPTSKYSRTLISGIVRIAAELASICRRRCDLSIIVRGEENALNDLPNGSDDRIERV